MTARPHDGNKADRGARHDCLQRDRCAEVTTSSSSPARASNRYGRVGFTSTSRLARAVDAVRLAIPGNAFAKIYRSMKPTAPDRMITSMFATAPCRGLSLSH